MTKARDLANAADVLDDVSATELSYVNGVTSAIQTQLNNKQAVVANVNDTEIGYLDGVTSAIQTQLDAKVAKSLVDAKGDLLVGSANDTVSRLAVASTAGYVLTVDSAETTGLKWAAASGGSPTFAGCSLKKNADQSINNATDTIITFDLEDYDTDAFHNNSTNNSRITIPSGKAGYYLFSGLFHFADNTNGIRTMELLKNGTSLGTISRSGNSAAGYDDYIAFSYVANGAVNDYFEMRLYQNSGGSLSVRTGTRFQASFLGA